MGSKRRNHRTQEAVVEPKRYAWFFPFALGAILAGFLIAVLALPTAGEAKPVVQAITPKALPTLGDLAAMPAKELEQKDLALLNLRCAEGLPGAEKLAVEQCLATLDRWATRVKGETQRHLYKYAQNPAEYEHSEGYFRMLMLITVLQQDFKVHYNPDRIREVDFTKSQDLFIHGMVGSDNGGTCVSMPALYMAVARRLGYPVYLVTAKEHVFCRWDDGKERFNVEATAQGLSKFDDSHYMTWPKPISPEEMASGQYLKSLTVAESLATFLAARGDCLEDNGKLALARVSYAQAAALSPRPIFQGFLVQSMGFGRSIPMQQARRTFDSPNVYLDPASAGLPPTVYQQPIHSPYQTAKPMVPGFPQQQFNGYPEPSSLGFGAQP